MDRQQILNGYAKLRENISQEKDKSFEKIVKYVNRNFNDQPKEEFINQVYNLILDSLEKTYALTAAAVREIYNIQDSNIENIDINKLTYSQDGKTLRERIIEHYSVSKEKQNNAFKIQEKESDIETDNIFAIYYENRLWTILNTEISNVSSQVLHNKIKEYASYAEVYGYGECSENDGSPCEEWLKMGKVPIDDIVELPPYHPNCECIVIYYIE